MFTGYIVVCIIGAVSTTLLNRFKEDETFINSHFAFVLTIIVIISLPFMISILIWRSFVIAIIRNILNRITSIK